MPNPYESIFGKGVTDDKAAKRLLALGVGQAIFNPNVDPMAQVNSYLQNKMQQQNLEDERNYNRQRQVHLDKLAEFEKSKAEETANKEKEYAAEEKFKSLLKERNDLLSSDSSYDEEGNLTAAASKYLDTLNKQVANIGKEFPDNIGYIQSTRDKINADNASALAKSELLFAISQNVFKTNDDIRNMKTTIDSYNLNKADRAEVLNALASKTSEQAKSEDAVRGAVRSANATAVGNNITKGIEKKDKEKEANRRQKKADELNNRLANGEDFGTIIGTLSAEDYQILGFDNDSNKFVPKE